MHQITVSPNSETDILSTGDKDKFIVIRSSTNLFYLLDVNTNRKYVLNSGDTMEFNDINQFKIINPFDYDLVIEYQLSDKKIKVAFHVRPTLKQFGKFKISAIWFILFCLRVRRLFTEILPSQKPVL